MRNYKRTPRLSNLIQTMTAEYSKKCKIYKDMQKLTLNEQAGPN